MKILTTRARAVAVSVAVSVALLTGAPVSAAPADHADAVEIFERDVFEIVGVTLRPASDATDAGAALFNTSGVSLGTTWGEWRAATASSEASVIGGPKRPRTDLRLALAGLVPGGLYSVFWGTLGPDSEHPLCPGVERTQPLDAVGSPAKAPAPNAFVADAAGVATFHGRTDGDLFDAAQVFFTVVYHFSGSTAYPFPNRGEYLTHEGTCRSSFGDDAMRQLLILQQW